MNKNSIILDLDESWLIKPSNAMVTRCIVDHAFTIDIQDSAYMITIRMGTQFVLAVNGNHKLISTDDVKAIGDALVVFNKRLNRGVAYSNGALDLEFSDNISIEVKPDEQYEAWELSVDDGTKLVSVPGGSLTIWGAT